MVNIILGNDIVVTNWVGTGATFEVDKNDPEYVIVKFTAQIDMKGNIPHWFMNHIGRGFIEQFKGYHKTIGDIKL